MTGGISLLADRLMDMSTFTVENVNDYLMADDQPLPSNSCVDVREEGPVAALVRGLLVAALPTRRLQGVWVDGASHAGRVHACISARERNGPHGDGEPDNGSCLTHANPTSSVYYLFAWIAPTLQYHSPRNCG